MPTDIARVESGAGIRDNIGNLPFIDVEIENLLREGLAVEDLIAKLQREIENDRTEVERDIAQDLYNAEWWWRAQWAAVAVAEILVGGALISAAVVATGGIAGIAAAHGVAAKVAAIGKAVAVAAKTPAGLPVISAGTALISDGVRRGARDAWWCITNDKKGRSEYYNQA